MPRLYTSLLTAALVLAAGSVASADSTSAGPSIPNLGVDPFESPEAFAEVYAGLRAVEAQEKAASATMPEREESAREENAADSVAPTKNKAATEAAPVSDDEPSATGQDATAESPALGAVITPDPQPETSAETSAETNAETNAESTAPEPADEADGSASATDSEDRLPASSTDAEATASSEADTTASEDATAEDKTEKDEAENDEVVPVAPRRQLSREMVQLRDRVRFVLRERVRQDFNVRNSTATDVMYYCLAFGQRAGVRTANQSRPVSGIGCLCYNYAFSGYRSLTFVDGRPAARVGYGRQAYPSQLVAVLAQSGVAPSFGVRIDKTKATVSDLIESEKLCCRAGDDLGLKLIGLAHYLPTDQTWENSDGDTWSLDRLIRAEMDRPFTTASCGGVQRLMGLSHAVQRRTKDGLPIDGGFARADKYLKTFHDHALSLQNSDGSWHPKFFRMRGASRDTAATLRSTGMILEWLAFSLPEEKLEDRRMVKALGYITKMLSSRRYNQNTPALPAREIAAVMHAAHGLSIYNQRVFKPADPPTNSDQVAEKSDASESR